MVITLAIEDRKSLSLVHLYVIVFPLLVLIQVVMSWTHSTYLRVSYC